MPRRATGSRRSTRPPATTRRNARRARLLIFSQIDVGGMKIGNAKIERFIQEHGFADWLATSAKTGENCSDQANAGQPSKLKQLIADRIPWDKLPWTATPRLLAELKNALLKMRDTADIRLAALRGTGAAAGAGPAGRAVRRVRRAHGGDAAGQSRPGPAAEVRRPGAAAARAAERLRRGDHPRRPRPQGRDRLRAGGGHLRAGLRLHRRRPADARPDEELLLRAMVQTFLDHSLCIAEETPQGRHLVFPSQYRREKDIPQRPGHLRLLHLQRRVADDLDDAGGAAVVQPGVRAPGAVAQRGGVRVQPQGTRWA